MAEVINPKLTNTENHDIELDELSENKDTATNNQEGKSLKNHLFFRLIYKSILTLSKNCFPDVETTFICY